MAEGVKLPPRQKMIGMMYLVLTALLALNVSKDILNAFLLVNDGLETTVNNYQNKNAILYSDFDKAKGIDAEKVTPYWEKAQKAKISSMGMIDYIEMIKKRLVQETDKISKEEADTLSLENVNGKENYDIPTNIMIGQSEDGSKGLARELKEKLNDYKSGLLALLGDKERAATHLDIKTGEIITRAGVENWEMGYFYHTPLAAAVTLLSKFQTDIKNAEFDIVNKLYQSVRKNDFTFDTIAAKVIPSSNYVLLGEDYQADVFVAAFSKTKNPSILIGDYDSTTQNLTRVSDSVAVHKGMGNYTVKTNKEGIFSYEGLIQLTSPSGVVKKYPFQSEYIVAKPSLVVSPDKMNVFYIGPKNPVSISVPGVASENIRATINGSGNRINKVGNGKYEVTLKNNSPREVFISVSASMPNGTIRSMGKKSFVVKKLPTPKAFIGGVSGKATASVNQIKQYRTIKVSYGRGFLFQGLPLVVTKATIERVRGGMISEAKINSGVLSLEAIRMLAGIRRNDRVFLSDVYAKDISGQIIKADNVVMIKAR